MTVATAIGALAGACLLVWIAMSYGWVQIFQVLAGLGWSGIMVVVLFHCVQMVCSALGWQAVATTGEFRPGVRVYFVSRWIREAVNNLLPLAQIGGEVVAVRLLCGRGASPADAIAGTVGDLLMEIATQVLFTAIGVFLLAELVGRSAVGADLMEGLLFAVAVTAAAFIAARLGLTALIERVVTSYGRSFGWPAAAQIRGLHASLMRRFTAPGRLTASAFWHLLSWLSGGIEVCLVLHFCGNDIALESGLIIESLGQAAKAAGFAVPGAIGVQEGGYVVAARLVGIESELAIALSLVKRLREIAWGVPALLQWYRSERARRDRAVA